MNIGDFIPSAGFIDTLSAVGLLVAGALAIITDKLVWHTRLKKAEARAEKWENIALRAMSAGARAGIEAAETAVEVVQSIPDPAKAKESRK